MGLTIKFGGPEDVREDGGPLTNATLRDDFAAKALGGMLAGFQALPDARDAELLARTAYELADAMLKARSA